MHARWVFVVGVAAGCEKLLSLQPVSASDAAGSADAATDGAIDAKPVCAPNPNVVRDAFDRAGSACASWANAYVSSGSGATITAGSGGLVVDIMPSGVKSYAGCTQFAPMALDDQGVFVGVDQIISNVGSWTLLALSWSSTDSVEIQTTYNGSILQMANGNGTIDYGHLAYLPSAMKYWRLRADSVQGAFFAEYSDDAATWKPLGNTVGMVSPPAQAEITLQAGDNNGAAGTAVFSHLNVCP